MKKEEIHEVLLRKTEFETTRHIDRRELAIRQHATFHQWEEHDVDIMVYNLRIGIWGKEHPETIAARYPADWWQAFKERWWPAWALKRWPVQYTEVVATLKELYPNLHPSLPDEESVMRMWKYERPASRVIMEIDTPATRDDI